VWDWQRCAVVELVPKTDGNEHPALVRGLAHADQVRACKLSPLSLATWQLHHRLPHATELDTILPCSTQRRQCLIQRSRRSGIKSSIR